MFNSHTSQSHCRKGLVSFRPDRACIAFALLGAALAASANNVSENSAWQFQSSADRVNQAAIQDMIRKQKSGYYAPPTYTTNIGRQYNCDVTANAVGNDGNNSTVANSPSNSGANSNASGNENTSGVAGGKGSQANTGQGNSGSVGSSVNGSTNTDVTGWASQALNSHQNNSGDQRAQVDGSSACVFGALN